MMTALVLVLAGSALPVQAQDALAEARLRRMEAEIRALQRQVFPGGDGKFFAPEIAPAPASGGATSAPPATTPVTDLLARMEALEAQIARLTAQVEENANKVAQLETRVAAASPATPPTPEPAPGPAPSPTAAADANLAAMTGGAAAPKPAPVATPAPAPASAVTPAPSASPAPRAAPSAAAPRRPAANAAPSPQRVAALRAIVKPQTNDPGDDEYSYGFRLWEAKFYPEAQQQLKLFLQKYPRHSRVSYARNLLGRAYLDEGNLDEAGRWFVENYTTDRTGARAADSVLFLAETMRRKKDTSRACIALAEFSDSFPAEAAGRLKEMYDQTRNGVKCN